MVKIFYFLISKTIDFIVEMPFVKRKLRGKNADKIIDLYSKKNHTRSFVKMRFWFGPLHELNKIVPKNGKILDIGSGEGILSNFLAISSKGRKITALELNKNRIREASKGIKNVKFLNKNALKARLPKTDNIVISHVLHHLGSRKSQEKLLYSCFSALNKGGKIYIAEVDRQVNLKYVFGWIADVVLIPIFFEKKLIDLKIYHRGRSEWVKLLKQVGFVIKQQKITTDKPYPEVILIAYKNARKK